MAEREAQGDKFAHLELLKGVQKLQNVVTTPVEKMLKMRFQLYQNVCVRLSQEYGIFEALVNAGRASASQLSETTKIDERLISECR